MTHAALPMFYELLLIIYDTLFTIYSEIDLILLLGQHGLMGALP